MKTNGIGSNTKEVTKKTESLADWLASQKGSLEVALPKGTIEIDRFMQSAMLAVYNPKQPQLAKCSPISIYRSLKESASLGLEVGGVLGQAYLIPYNETVNKGGKQYKEMTCHFQIGYKGLIALARRSNTIKTIACEPVYSNDIFTVQLGCNRSLDHRLDLTKSRGEIIGYYCLVELTNGGIQFDVESVEDIKNHRDKFSKAYKKTDPENIWNKNFDAMALKTCCIQALKLCPISIEALEAVRKEELADTKDNNSTVANSINMSDVQDVEYTIQDEEDTVKTNSQDSVEPDNQEITPEEEAAIEAAFDRQQEMQQAAEGLF